MNHHLLRKFPSIMKCPRCVTSMWYLSCTPSNLSILFLSSLHSIFNGSISHNLFWILFQKSFVSSGTPSWSGHSLWIFFLFTFLRHWLILLQYLRTLNAGSWTAYTFILLLRKAPSNRWRSKLTFFSLKFYFISPLDDYYLVIKANWWYRLHNMLNLWTLVWSYSSIKKLNLSLPFLCFSLCPTLPLCPLPFLCLHHCYLLISSDFYPITTHTLSRPRYCVHRRYAGEWNYSIRHSWLALRSMGLVINLKRQSPLITRGKNDSIL